MTKVFTEKFCVDLKKPPERVLEVIEEFQKRPPKAILPVVAVRDKIAKLFSLKTANDDAFRIKEISANEVHIEFTDWHLRYFGRLSLSDKKLCIHNRIEFIKLFGRLYFYSIFPGHWLVFKLLLREANKRFS